MAGPDRISWPRAFVELVVIVAGVAIALAADAWRVDLADRRTEREYLSRLRSELETGRAAIAANRDRVSQSVAAIDALLPLEPWGDGEESTFVDLTLRAANYTFNEAGIVYDLTYREMSATGSLNLIRDPRLRVRLTNYYRLAYRTAQVNRESSRAYAERVESIIGIDPGVGFMPEESSHTPPPLDAATRDRLRRALVGSREVAGELRLLISHLRGTEAWLDRLVASTDSLLATLP